MNCLHVKKGDVVALMTGKYKDKFSKPGVRKTGKILEVSPKEGKVIIEGINRVKKHVKPRGQKPGGIVEAEAPVYACKVQLVCPKCDKPTRVGHDFREKGDKKEKVRVCKKCGAVI
ncbi:MAG: 50S ribosomal protein L24 [Oscillospiraceae bacterium]|jgi:large subunit ribosomal protein L24|nr:50S ribosomal protein L24 [Oscillospiraceae bacterium]